MSQPLKLLATDFDGTLMTLGVEQGATCRDSFQGWVEDIQQHGGIWVLCTGRDYASFRMAYPFLECPGISPDFLVTRRGRVFQFHNERYTLRPLITARVVLKRYRASRKVRALMKQVVDFIGSGVEEVVAGDANARRIRVSLSDDSAGARAAQRIRNLQQNGEYLSVSHEGPRIEVRPVPQSKGIALRELQNLLDIDTTETLAVGDGSNDLSMFNESVAQWTGCPANSVGSVIDAIVQRGGHVAREKGMGGTVEVINASLRGEVSSMPLPRMSELLPLSTNVDGMAQRIETAKLREIALGAGATLTVLAVLCSVLLF